MKKPIDIANELDKHQAQILQAIRAGNHSLRTIAAYAGLEFYEVKAHLLGGEESCPLNLLICNRDTPQELSWPTRNNAIYLNELGWQVCRYIASFKSGRIGVIGFEPMEYEDLDDNNRV